MYNIDFNETADCLPHHFRKKSQKTPPREIERAFTEMMDYLSRKESE